MQELMKKIVYAIAALAIIFTGCAKELDNSTKDNFSKVRLHVKVADQMTKVSADNDGRYHWQAHDKISVLNDAGKAFEFETEEGGGDVDFSGTISTGDLGSYAMYPSVSTNEAAGNTVSFHLPTTIDWVADATNMPMLGKIAENKATFRSVGGVLKLVCYNIPSGASWLQFTATSQKIVGEFLIDGSEDYPVLETENTDKVGDKELSIDFSGHYSSNMVFYIPLPTGTINGFTVAFLDGELNELFTKTTVAAPTVARNQMIIAPALNCDSAEDAILTNDELVSKAAADSWSSYKSGSITNSYGTWSYNAAYQGNYEGDGKYYIQIVNGRDPVSYIKLPSFAKNIGQIILHRVTNGKNEKYTGSIYFASESTEPVTAIATAPVASSAKEDLAIDIPSGYTTGYLKATTACRIAEITVKFRSGACDEPSISPADNPIIIAVSSGDVNSASTTVTYSTSLTDDLGVSIASHSDWITPTLTGTGPYNLTVSADKKVTAGDREGFVTLRASGVSKTIVVRQPSALVGNPTVVVTDGNGTFNATWSPVDNVTSYLAYFGDTDGLESNPTALTALDPSYDDGTGKWSVSKSGLTNGETYYLYVKPNAVTANYCAPTTYVKATVTPKSSAPLDDPDVSLTAVRTIGFVATWTNDANAYDYSWVLSTASSSGAVAPANTLASGSKSDAELSGDTWTLNKAVTLTSGTTYYFYIQAKGSGFYTDSGYSSASKAAVAPKTGTLTLGSSNKFGTASGSTKNDNQGNTWTCTGSDIQNSYQTTYSGQQFGTGSTDNVFVFSANFSGKIVTNVAFTGAAGNTKPTYDISVGGSSWKSGNLTKTATSYSQSGNGTGTIEITLDQNSGGKAVYLGIIEVVYFD